MAITKDLVGWNSWATGPLRSGPMLGEVGENDALVWAQARDTSLVTLTVYPPGASSMQFVATPAVTDGLCVVFHITGLAYGTKYEYDLSSQHGTTPRHHLRAGLPKHSRRARIVFGPCYKDYANNGLTIFDSIAKEQADVFLMTGDNCYFPNNSQNEADDMLIHLRHRNNDALRKLIPNISVLGIWDDHDFGPNDSDSSYGGRNDSLSAFKHVWAQRKYGLPEAGIPGIFSSARYGPVEIFLLDGRYNRVKKHHILGKNQLNWLKNQLQNSTAPVKLILSGSVVLPEFVKTIEGGSWEGWRRDAPGELDVLLSHIEEHDIRGVIFTSGDLHLGYLMHRSGTTLPNEKQGPEYWEVVSSPLAHNPWNVRVKVGPNAPTYDPWLVEEVVGPNYGQIDINLDRTGREICLNLKNEHGVTCVARSVALDSLCVQQAVKKLSAVVWSGNKAYFFKGDQYVRYNIGPGPEGVNPGYPKPIKGNWKGLAEAFPNGIDAAIVWPNGKAYFFKGDQYVRYTTDPATEGVDSGYPKPVQGNWPGLGSL